MRRRKWRRPIRTRSHRLALATRPLRFLKSPVGNLRGTCIWFGLHQVGTFLSLETVEAVWLRLSLTAVLTPPGTFGKSIRTEDSWLTPQEFLEKGLAPPHNGWRVDIECEGQPLNSLIEVVGVFSGLTHFSGLT